MFELTIEKKANIIWVNLFGKLIDPDDAAQLEEKLGAELNKNTNNLIFNLKELHYINSSGLNCLIKLFTRSRNLGGDAIICNMNESVQNLVLITKLNTVFSIVENISNIDEYIKNK